jgi:hypothetical protein
MSLRGAVLTVPIMLRVALRSPDDRTEAVGVARVARQLYADAVDELGEVEAEDLVGATLRYVRDRIMAVYGAAAWEDAAQTLVAREASVRNDDPAHSQRGRPIALAT